MWGVEGLKNTVQQIYSVVESIVLGVEQLMQSILVVPDNTPP